MDRVSVRMKGRCDVWRKGGRGGGEKRGGKEGQVMCDEGTSWRGGLGKGSKRTSRREELGVGSKRKSWREALGVDSKRKSGR